MSIGAINEKDLVFQVAVERSCPVKTLTAFHANRQAWTFPPRPLGKRVDFILTLSGDVQFFR